MEIIGFGIFGVLIVISPGADFILVLKNALSYGRNAGFITAMGIAAGVCVHVTYSIFGISHLIAQSDILFSLVRYAGSAYLIYLGLTGLFGSKPKLEQSRLASKTVSVRELMLQGFFCNLLNPKTMLFFLSVFSQVIDSGNTEDLGFALGYGLYIALLHGAWFCLLAVLLSSSQIAKVLRQFDHRINQICGVGLCTFGVLLSIKT